MISGTLYIIVSQLFTLCNLDLSIESLITDSVPWMTHGTRNNNILYMVWHKITYILYFYLIYTCINFHLFSLDCVFFSKKSNGALRVRFSEPKINLKRNCASKLNLICVAQRLLNVKHIITVLLNAYTN